MKRFVLPLYEQKRSHSDGFQRLICLDKGYLTSDFMYKSGYKLKYFIEVNDIFPMLSINGFTKRQLQYLFKHLQQNQVDYHNICNQMLVIKFMNLVKTFDYPFSNIVLSILFNGKYLTPQKVLLGNLVAKHFKYNVKLKHTLLKNKFNATPKHDSFFDNVFEDSGGAIDNKQLDKWNKNTKKFDNQETFERHIIKDCKLIKSRHLL